MFCRGGRAVRPKNGLFWKGSPNSGVCLKKGGLFMLQERRSKIIDKIQQDNVVKVSELMEEFGVSIETIRRDL